MLLDRNVLWTLADVARGIAKRHYARHLDAIPSYDKACYVHQDDYVCTREIADYLEKETRAVRLFHERPWDWYGDGPFPREHPL